MKRIVHCLRQSACSKRSLTILVRWSWPVKSRGGAEKRAQYRNLVTPRGSLPKDTGRPLQARPGTDEAGRKSESKYLIADGSELAAE